MKSSGIYQLGAACGPALVKKFLLVLSCSTLSSVIDVAAVGLLFPFLTLAANPQIFDGNALFVRGASLFGATSVEHKLVLCGALVGIFLVISNVLSLLANWMRFRLIAISNTALSSRLLSIYLAKPLEFFHSNNVADLSKNIVSEVDNVVINYTDSVIILISRSIGIIAAFLVVASIDPGIAVLATSILCMSYLLVFGTLKNRLKDVGAKMVQANRKRFLSVGEALVSIREAKSYRAEKRLIDDFKRASDNYHEQMRLSSSLPLIPRYVVETICLVGIIIYSLFLIVRNGSLESAAPTLGVFAFAAYRQLPALQAIFHSASRMRSSRTSVKLVVEALGRFHADGHTATAQSPIKSMRRIELRDVTFSYAGSGKLVLENANLSIHAGQMVGLVGGSGAGKTTLVDILTGILMPTSGFICVDGKPLAAQDLSGWLDVVGYVPQHVHLADTNVRENIAFSISADAIDDEQMAVSAEIANAESFIANLAGRFDALVGDRGALLSGGQIQRIGIARAMYKRPKLLILDEATNALDEETEKTVLSNLLRRCSGSGLAVLVVAHRKSTLSFCTTVYEVSEGSIRPVAVEGK